ncbi:uncharacterized protein [Dermacentor albipictus]|uniref:uncharacterized protein isoform X7 n=1 Tax=Dermacentor albipictus TaxID=60249 RepID=UPI0038FD0C49
MGGTRRRRTLPWLTVPTTPGWTAGSTCVFQQSRGDRFLTTSPWLMVGTVGRRTAGPSSASQVTRTLPWLVVRTSLGQTAGSRTTSPWFMVRTAGGPTAGPSSVSQVTRTFPWLMKQTTGRRTAWPVSRFSAYKIDMVTRPSSTMVSDSSPSEPGGQLFYKPDVLIPALPNWWTADIAKCPVDMVAI